MSRNSRKCNSLEKFKASMLLIIIEAGSLFALIIYDSEVPCIVCRLLLVIDVNPFRRVLLSLKDHNKTWSTFLSPPKRVVWNGATYFGAMNDQFHSRNAFSNSPFVSTGFEFVKKTMKVVLLKKTITRLITSNVTIYNQVMRPKATLSHYKTTTKNYIAVSAMTEVMLLHHDDDDALFFVVVDKKTNVRWGH